MRDHMQASGLAHDASFVSTFPHLFTECIGKKSDGADYKHEHGSSSCLCAGLAEGETTESGSTANFPPVFYMDTLAGIGFIPTEYVDISDVMEQKLQALACHESQIKWMLDHDRIDFLDFVRTCNKYRGLQAGVAYAEGFRQYAGWPRFRTERMLP